MKPEGAKLQDAGISLKQCPEKMSGRKRLAYGTRKIGVLPAETSGQVKRKRKSQLCDDHHRFESGGRFDGLLPFAAVTSGLPTTRELKLRLASAEAKRCSRSVLKGEPQAEFDLTRRAERVNPRSEAYAIYVVSNGSGSVNLPRSSRQQSVQRCTR